MAAIKKSAKGSLSPSGKKVKILLVEDDRMIVEMYHLKFQEEGYDVVIAEDGKMGLAKAIDETPDIILLDVILPEMDGFSVLKCLKNEELCKNIPVILLTNLGQDGDVKRGLQLGAVDYLIKANYTPSQVVARIKSYI
ncbi:MAG: two-component system, OmpR family, alkaline phosphatase synthesis response regulator PhoP [Parcubacteria group bacterium Gr01-1014_18]|nr:MAG: two-component system, OmpR family, alkaline phosphatase synthesis response regulator PhoP [Parcubacteria group bacterium Greene0416_36]TSC81302.1 MAG: two-component system, OmpR family, alkaline phosphatase synthesis response regulator PhoP [Parcubacteria group bacterium Gr01-1014_18]TSC99324.1 MAG: two-component system, OmpR family, alkaline phosphatase synthesis response regulator PhoP [Parcubacteria group bacterium Greene1014_20]TSD06839.1 MAG: two-component system, OmpR family, alkal